MAAINKPNDAPAATTLSQQAAEMLRAIGKNHLRDVTNDEWARYGFQHGLAGREALCAEYWLWHLPDRAFLESISGKEGLQAQVEHRESVGRTTADFHTQIYAESHIKLLQNQTNEREKL
jgi:hypothetical protein